MDILEQTEPICPQGETLKIRLSCNTTQTWKKVRFRLEWHYQDGQIIGTMLANETIDYAAGDTKDMILHLDTSHFAPGKYSANIIAYVQNEFGTERFLDGVYPGLKLTISESGKNKDYITWMHNHWGHLRLHDITISKP